MVFAPISFYFFKMSFLRLTSRIVFFDIKLCNYKVHTFFFSDFNDGKVDTAKDIKKPGGFAQSFEKFETINEINESPQSFASLLRYSPFIDVSK